MSPTIVIGISSDLPHYDFAEKLDTLLQDVDDYKIIPVNDSKRILESFAFDRKKEILIPTTGKARSDLKQAIARGTHLIVFWSGYDLSELIYFASLKRIPIRIVAISLTTVVNRDQGKPFDVYIGRGTIWGNPFPIDHALGVDRNQVIERYRTHFYQDIISDPEKRRHLEGLRGLRLACHCKPSACHGDIIADYLNTHDESGNKLEG